MEIEFFEIGLSLGHSPLVYNDHIEKLSNL